MRSLELKGLKGLAVDCKKLKALLLLLLLLNYYY